MQQSIVCIGSRRGDSDDFVGDDFGDGGDDLFVRPQISTITTDVMSVHKYPPSLRM